MTNQNYTIGDLASVAKVSTKAIRIYEQKGLLTSIRDESNNYRFFDEEAKLQLQRIQMLRYLGFSLDAIRCTLSHYNKIDLEKSFFEQKKLLEEKVLELQRMIHCVDKAAIECKQADFNIDSLFESINRIIIDRAADEGVWVLGKYSNEPEGWSKWIFDQAGLFEGQKVMDAGSGWGNLWRYNLDRIPNDMTVCCVDKHNTHADSFYEFAKEMPQFSFAWGDLEVMDFEEKYDCIFFNHVVHFIEDPLALYHKFAEALKNEGKFICTWGGSLLLENLAELLVNFMPSRAAKIRSRIKEKLEKFSSREIDLTSTFATVEKRVYKISLHYENSRDLAEFLKGYGEKLDFDFSDCMEEFYEYISKRYEGKPIEFDRDSYLFICKAR